MKKIALDTTKLLGFRIADADRNAATLAKVGRGKPDTKS